MRKPKILFLPGLLCDDALWAHQTQEMSDIADCTVTDMTRDNTMSGMAGRILDTAPERFSLCGLSMGGYCALEVMRQQPHRVDRLALIDTSARADVPEQTANRGRLMERVENGEFEDVLDELLPLFIHPDLHSGPHMDTIRQSARNIGPETFLRQQEAIISRGDGRPVLGNVSCPTLILCGRQDALTPVDLHEEMADRASGSRLRVIEDCGHLAPLEKPLEVTAVLKDWLSDDLS